jgi:hypothetical protein
VLGADEGIDRSSDVFKASGLCPLLRIFIMGRAGLEPATLGLKVPCSTS